MVEQGSEITLFLCGDVMTGRGIDQILPHPCAPQLFESWVTSARDYVALAERAHGAIARPVPDGYLWGDALQVLQRLQPRARIINLETAVTAGGTPWPGKGIHYRMHPGNLPALSALGPDCCVLANNHVLDWGYQGLHDTLHALHAAGIATAGAGPDLEAARAPARLPLGDGGKHLLVFAWAMEDSGTPRDWAASHRQAGVAWLPDPSPEGAARILDTVAAHRRPGDLVIVSLHWGSNWGDAVPARQRIFARQLVEGGVDLVHGHSSHHPRTLEVWNERLILYGCGDFLNDYEGITGHEDYRPDLALMVFPTLDTATGRLLRLRLVPTRICHLRVEAPTDDDTAWLHRRMAQLTRHAALGIERDGGDLVVTWH